MTLCQDLIFSPLAEPCDIARWDKRAAAEYALPTLLLMENAARAARLVLEEFYGIDNGPEGTGWHGLEALVLAGGGNNGGDGIALARQLHNLGCRVLLFTLIAPGRYKGICRAHLNMARKAGLEAHYLRLPVFKNTEQATESAQAAQLEKLTRAALRQLENPFAGGLETETTGGMAGGVVGPRPQIVVDAITGAGFKAPLRPAALAAVRAVNILRDRGSFVLALDIPSGLNALSGRPGLPYSDLTALSGGSDQAALSAPPAQPRAEAVRASACAVFAAAKPGLCLPWARDYTGALQVCEIGLPANLLRQDPSTWQLVAPRPGALPAPGKRVHKAQKGRVLVIGGSAGLTGAPALAALGAARAGAGLVTVAAPAGLSREIKHGLPEIMTLPLGGSGSAGKSGTSGKDCHWQPEHLPPLLEYISELGPQAALVLGPGLGRDPFIATLLRAVLELPQRPPLVLDADGLFPFRLEAGPGDATGASGNNGENAQFLPLTLLRPSDVITPHAGEMLRILGGGAVYGKLLELPERLAALRRLGAVCPAALLLKGAGTLIAQNPALALSEAGAAGPTGTTATAPTANVAATATTADAAVKFPVALVPFAEPNLAVGGSGDVLSGLIAALLARNLPCSPGLSPALAAACLGAHAHGRAGQLTRRSFPAGGNLASDIADQLSLALRELDRI